ncbi:MAG TPA: ABC transporter permease [Candidatus Limnocylindria bacterium]|nr:ABC transporter permease [Candidatus Limnocylindria bacterium]
MNVIVDVARWFADPAHYQGSDAVQTRVLEHLAVSGLAVLVAILIALPIGLYLGHTGRFGFIAVNVANIGRAIPSFAAIALGMPIAAMLLGVQNGLGLWPTFFGLLPLGLPPILTNAYVAVRAVDADVVEAARGMGVGEGGILRGIEIPLALPLVIAGIRTAAVNVVATATLGAVVAFGGLGRYIVDGLALQEYDRLLAGAVLVALVAIAVEVTLGRVERATVSPGIRIQPGAF